MVELFIVEATDTFQAELGSRISMYSSRLGGGDILRRTQITGPVGTPPTANGSITNAAAGGSISSTPIASPTGGIIGTFLGNTTDLRVELQAMENESLILIPVPKASR